MAPGDWGIWSSSSSLPKRFRSSARSIDSGEVPMIGTPAAFRGSARFRGVCPPNCTITPTGAPPDAVRSAAQDDDFLFRGGRRLIFFLVRRVQVWRVALELGCARVHALVDRHDTMLFAQVADLLLGALAVQTPDRGQPPVGEAHALGIA